MSLIDACGMPQDEAWSDRDGFLFRERRAYPSHPVVLAPPFVLWQEGEIKEFLSTCSAADKAGLTFFYMGSGDAIIPWLVS